MFFFLSLQTARTSTNVLWAKIDKENINRQNKIGHSSLIWIERICCVELTMMQVMLLRKTKVAFRREDPS